MEFVEVMRQWKRMCNAVPEKAESMNLCSDKKSGYVCPLRENGLCNLAIGAQSIEDWKEGEHIIMAWAAEHKEPVYPRWIDWLADVGLIINTADHYAFNFTAAVDQIPADMAEKLGIAPKEG